MFEKMNDAHFGMFAGMAEGIGELKGKLNQWMAYARKLEAENSEQAETISKLVENIKILNAHIAGLEAQMDALKAGAPNNPALADSGKRYKSGNIKTKSRLAYEAAHDAEARKQGLRNPETIRSD